MFCTIQLLVIFLYSVYSTNNSVNEFNISKHEIDTINTIIASKLPTSTVVNDTAFDYLYGNQSEDIDNIDFGSLDIDTQSKLYNVAKMKNMLVELELNKSIGRMNNYNKEAYYQNAFFVKKTMDLMEQSVYATRYRLQDTRPLRKKYQQDIPYNMAILYGSLMEMRMKIDNTYMTLKKLYHSYKFIYFLYLYERLIALNTDVEFMVRRMFKMAEVYKQAFGDVRQDTPAPMRNPMIG